MLLLAALFNFGLELFDLFFQGLVLIHLPLVFGAQASVEALAVVHHQVEDRRVTLETRADLVDALVAVGVEQPVEDLARLVQRGDRLARPAA